MHANVEIIKCICMYECINVVDYCSVGGWKSLSRVQGSVCTDDRHGLHEPLWNSGRGSGQQWNIVFRVLVEGEMTYCHAQHCSAFIHTYIHNTYTHKYIRTYIQTIQPVQP